MTESEQPRDHALHGHDATDVAGRSGADGRGGDDAGDDALEALGRDIGLLARNAALSRPADAEELFERAAVLRDNAMGIIYDGDGSSDHERVGRLLALVPALLTVVDEARDTIERLRALADEKDPPKLISPYDVEGRSEPDPPRWGSVGGDE